MGDDGEVSDTQSPPDESNRQAPVADDGVAATGVAPSDHTPAADGPVAPADASQNDSGKAPKKPNRISLSNIVRSMGILLVLVVGAVFLQQRGGNPVPTVDPTQTLIGSAQRAHYGVLAPAGLSSGWKDTSARDATGAGGTLTVELGYVTPSGQFAQLVQSDTEATTFDKARLSGAGAKPLGSAVQVAGRSWVPYPPNKSGDRAWLATSKGVRILMTGNASAREFSELATSLRPFRPKN